MDISNKVAIITGAARGIGLLLAARFCQAGARVVLADLGREELEAAVVSLRRDFPRAQCLAVKVDVSDRTSVEDMVKQAISAFGRIDILVNNAGVWKDLTPGPFWQIENSEWQRAFKINTEGSFNCAAVVAPHMIHQKAGRIIFVGSAAIGEALATVTHYTASKSAITGLMRCAAKELGKDGITVNMVNPGQIDTGAFSREQLESRARTKFIQRVGVPDDLAGIVTFLASDQSSFITAQQIYVDGGGVLN